MISTEPIRASTDANPECLTPRIVIGSLAEDIYDLSDGSFTEEVDALGKQAELTYSERPSSCEMRKTDEEGSDCYTCRRCGFIALLGE